MKCTHVVGLIDAGPFADYPRDHLDAAWRHARACATCGPALEASRKLAADLGALPTVRPPRDLSGSVLARIAELEDARVPAPEPVDTLQERNWPAWATAGGVCVVAAAVVVGFANGARTWFEMIQRPDQLVPALPEMSLTSGAAVLVAGLILYLAGLFAPLREKGRPPSTMETPTGIL